MNATRPCVRDVHSAKSGIRALSPVPCAGVGIQLNTNVADQLEENRHHPEQTIQRIVRWK